MNRIIDANLNRANEAFRVLEEISRFVLNDKETTKKIKLLRHNTNMFFDQKYEVLIHSRDTIGDVGTDIVNPDHRTDLESIFKANFKRLEEALRVLGEYANLPDSIRYKIYELEKNMYGGIKMNNKNALLDGKNLYLVTNSDNFNSADEFLNAVAVAIRSGIKIVQLREKSRPTNEIIELGRKIRAICDEFEALFIVNDRIDLAMILGADGVHLGQDDIDILSARKILGDSKIIGISTHTIEQAEEAIKKGADYIAVGPIMSTPTKPDVPAIDDDFVEYVLESVKIPYFVIGGIALDNIKTVKKFVIQRFAFVREIMNAKNIAQTVKELCKIAQP